MIRFKLEVRTTNYYDVLDALEEAFQDAQQNRLGGEHVTSSHECQVRREFDQDDQPFRRAKRLE